MQRRTDIDSNNFRSVGSIYLRLGPRIPETEKSELKTKICKQLIEGLEFTPLSKTCFLSEIECNRSELQKMELFMHEWKHLLSNKSCNHKCMYVTMFLDEQKMNKN